jgi:hypothetical protein
MRLVGIASLVSTLALTPAISEFAPATTAHQRRSEDDGERNRDDGERNHRNGQAIFRSESFNTVFDERCTRQ